MIRYDIHGTTPRERGIDRGRQVAQVVRDHWDTHRTLFAAVGRSEADTLALGLESLDATAEWWPEAREEIVGIAEGAELDLSIVAALNARTELLVAPKASRSDSSPAADIAASTSTSTTTDALGHECTSVAITDPFAAQVQTWDWHRELNRAWHVQRVTGTPVPYAGITEHGILAKIGRNDAGVGIIISILSHQDDAAGKVPIHVISHRVLSEARSLAHARELLLDAPVGASTVFTVVGPDGIGSFELSPAGAAELEPFGRWFIHSNHFLSPELAGGSRTFRNDPDSQERLQMLQDRISAEPDITTAAQLAPMLHSGPGDIGNICCVPTPDQPLGRAWETQATVWMTRDEMTISAGSPRDLATAEQVRFAGKL